jgi:hypothetical protein
VTPERRLLAIEAALLLLTAKTALRVLPVRWIVRFLGRPVAPGGVKDWTECSMRKTSEVRWAVLSVARSSPIRFVCFPQCVAASVLLRGRGIGSVLHYGVTRKDGALATHTWLQAGDRIVIGGEVSEEYTLLSSF